MADFQGETLLFDTQLSKAQAPSGKRAMCISSRYGSKKKTAEKAARWKAEQKKKRKKKARQNRGQGKIEQKRPRTDSLIVEPLQVTGEVDDVFEDATVTSSTAYIELKDKVLARLNDPDIIQCKVGAVLEERIEEILKREEQDTFYLLDLSTVLIKYLAWKEHLPRVMPFYATKCNPDRMLTETLVTCGAGMDVASMGEMKLALSLGVNPEDLIFANPCKNPTHISFAKKHDVRMMTFDNMGELDKVAKLFPEAELVIRILSDDSHSTCRFGSKFGADKDKEVEPLLDAAYSKGLNVVGVSFHVGSGCQDAVAYRNTLQMAREVFDMAESKGHPMTLLDIGGGMPGVDSEELQFATVAKEITSCLNEFFPDEGIRVIGEPGRYFASECMVLVASVIAKREREIGNSDTPDEKPEMCAQYYISDGVYGSFNNLFFDHATASPIPLKKDESGDTQRSVVFGPTCDSIDLLCEDVQLPNLEVGDFVYFFNMGAYTNAAASCFNGFERPQIHYMIT
mmetsp:Transcript_14601/g.57325  ORF Transcript_14601/g.57325 Transcript_14601/m.57325 type:complete len:512 (-) Transcript_14601:74-1609(-)